MNSRLLVVVALLCGLTYCAYALPQSMPPQYSSGPVTEYSAALPPPHDVLRFRRGERYDISDPSVPELGPDSDPLLLQLPTTHFKREPVPVDSSDAVVVGIITSGQAYLSNDRREIYSEFRCDLQDVIKVPSNHFIRVGDSIDIERKGGVVRLASGKVLTRGSTAESMPQEKKKYLLFLKYNQTMEDYSLITGYLLEGGRVYYLDDMAWQTSQHQRLEHPLREEEKNENEFLANVRSVVSIGKKGAN